MDEELTCFSCGADNPSHECPCCEVITCPACSCKCGSHNTGSIDGDGHRYDN